MPPRRIILGCADEVVDQLQGWQEATGAETIIVRLRQAYAGGPPHENILRAIRPLGDQVTTTLA